MSQLTVACASHEELVLVRVANHSTHPRNKRICAASPRTPMPWFLPLLATTGERQAGRASRSMRAPPR
jgi:hypothetical protein